MSVKTPNLLEFHREERRTKKAYGKSSTTAFSETSKKRANRFARALCADLDSFLRQYEMMAVHEKASEYRGAHRINAIAEAVKTSFWIRTDIHILACDSTQHLANLEVKFMPAGMIRYDAKKIAYQFMHLNEQFPQQRNFIVYGGKFIQKEHSISHLLRTFSHGFFQLTTESDSEALTKSFKVFCENILVGLKKKRKHYGIIPTRRTSRIAFGQTHERPSSNRLGAVDKRSHTQKKRNGFVFEEGVGTILESMGISYASRNRIDVSVSPKIPISIELDYSIPKDGEIGVIIECKNCKSIGTTPASNIAFDVIMLKRKYPDAIYLLVLGPDVEKWSSPHLRRYVDWTLTIDNLPRFIKKQFPHLVSRPKKRR